MAEPDTTEFKKTVDFKLGFKDNTRQGILKRMAMAYSDKDGRGYFIMYEIVMMLLARQGHEPLKKVWKEKYDENLKKLKRLGMLLGDMTVYISSLNQKKLLKEAEVADPRFIQYRHLFAKSSYHIDILYEAFYHLMDSTSVLQHLDIDTTYWSDTKKEEVEE